MQERGFTLVETPPFLSANLYRGLKRPKMTLAPDCKQWLRFPQLARYGYWLELLLGMALPEEDLALVALEFRREPAGTVDPEVDGLHVDGSYLSSVVTLYGAATVYREGKAELPLPGGQTLLMTAMGRARALGVPCTLHRRPGAGPERALIVCSFEPRQAQPELMAVYRRVGDIAAVS
jgi:hypothetical protein